MSRNERNELDPFDIDSAFPSLLYSFVCLSAFGPRVCALAVFFETGFSSRL